MIKKILLLFFTSFLFLINTASAQDVIKIKKIHFDKSKSIIFMETSGIDASFPITVEKGKLSDPDRIFFDIKNAIYIPSNSNYLIENSPFKQVKIAQFSNEPDIVRVAIYYDKRFDPNNLKILKQNNSLILKPNTIPLRQQITQEKPKYLNQIYIETPQKIAIPKRTPAPKKVAMKPPSSQNNVDMFNQIQKAFNETTDEIYLEIEPDKPSKSDISTKPQPVRENPPLKEHHVKAKYYINRISVRNGNVLVNGIGAIGLEKFIYLTDPKRIAIDIPGAIVAEDLRNKELQISPTESVRIGQFEPLKARVVITTDQPEKYRPIYSFDLQGLLIAHEERIGSVKLFNTSSNISLFRVIPVTNDTNNIIIDFSNPIVHSVKREKSKLDISLYNVTLFNTERLKQIIKSSNLSNIKLEKLPYQGTKITIPIENDSTIDCYENLEATQLKITLKTPKKVKKRHLFRPTLMPRFLTGRVVVLDPGHGGIDTGALKAGVNEKDITLDIAKKTARILINKGIHVEMTRWNDSTVSLKKRVEFANQRRADIYVSIHVNSSVKPDIHGIETHYYTKAGFKAARIIHKSLMHKISSADRGLFKSRFYVINHTKAPSVLLELGFISNTKERNALLTERRKNKSAEAIANGIINYLNSQPKR